MEGQVSKNQGLYLLLKQTEILFKEDLHNVVDIETLPITISKDAPITHKWYIGHRPAFK